MTDDAPRFDIPRYPDRVYPRNGGVEYEGGTVFRLSPDDEVSDEELTRVVETVLGDDRYTYGDWFELPAPVYLVHDEPHSTAFRVVIRYGSVEFHVLPETMQEALQTLYARLREEADCSWQIESETTGPD